jgi:hypothetical protein
MNELTVTDEQRDLVQKTLAPDASPMELELFFYDNKRRGVHPLDRLIHFTKRNGRYVPITSIHFMRAKADEGGRAGQEVPSFAGKELMPDYECAVTVYKVVNGERVPYIGVAKWKEYYPGEVKEGFMWRKMPSHMLAKCAEANALRLGFPRELAGLHIEEEVHVLDEPQSVHQDTLPPLTLKDKLKAKVEASQEPPVSSVLEPSTEEVLHDLQPATDLNVGEPPEVEAHRGTLRTCKRSREAINATYYAIPEPIRQDCYTCYTDQLKSLTKKK